MKNFKKLCEKTQKELKDYLRDYLGNTLNKKTFDVSDEGFLFAEGTVPILLVAHLDTVHTTAPKKFYWNKKNKSLSSPQGIGGDDRCGVYMILEMLKEFDCSVLFTEDEEIGCIGAETFTKEIEWIETGLGKKLEYNYIIEFDRANSKDAVFYDCDNKEFANFICQEFYEETYGSFSDISTIAPVLGVAAVNLSCGYYKAHTTEEYVIFDEMKASLEAAKNIIRRTDFEKDKFEFIERKNKWNWTYGWSSYDYGYGYAEEEEYVIEYMIDNYGEEQCDIVMATSEEEAIGKFLMEKRELCYNDILSYYPLEPTKEIYKEKWR